MEAKDLLKTEEIIKEIKQAGIRFVVAVPDRVTSDHLLKGIMEEPALRLVQVCKEDEGVSICSGLYCAGQRALLLIQHTGMLDSANALRGVAVEGKNPVCLMVGLLGNEPGIEPAKAGRYGVRIVGPVLDAMEIEHHLVEDPGDVGKIVPAVERAYARCQPVALLIGREPQ